MDASPPAGPRGLFWQRRIVAPIITQLTQGVTPQKIALTLALGLACGVFPFLGLTTALCFAVAFIFKLNQPIIHVINQLLWPVQLSLIAVYVKAGAWLYHADVATLNLPEMTRIFWSAQREFWARFGMFGVYALCAWLITLPVIVGISYRILLPGLQKMASGLQPRS